MDLSFQMPCRTHFSESWMQRSIISNEKVFLTYIWQYFLRTDGCFYTLLVPKV
eukprot:UN20820